MTERTEWPTSEKLDRLRAEGVVAYSAFATACFVLSAVAVVFGLFAEEWGGAVTRYREIVLRGEVWAGWWECLTVVSHALVVFGGVVGIVVVISGLAQTRFLFEFSRLAPNLERLSPLRRFSFGAPVRAVLLSGMRFLLGVGVAAALCGVFFRDMAGLLNHGLDYVVSHARGALQGATVWFAVVAFACGVVCWGLEWFTFRLRHRMTRAEVLADRAER